MHQRTKDMTGLRIGKLEVIRFSHSEKRPSGSTFAYWVCKCDCGNQKTILGSNLRRGDKRNTQSCGCLQKERTASKDPVGVQYRRYISHYKKNAKKRGYKPIWELSRQQFDDLIKSTCHYCGTVGSIKMHVGGGLRNGIDQISPRLGYVFDNCVSSCFACNQMKRDMPQDDFKAHVTKIYNHLNKGN